MAANDRADDTAALRGAFKATLRRTLLDRDQDWDSSGMAEVERLVRDTDADLNARVVSEPPLFVQIVKLVTGSLTGNAQNIERGLALIEFMLQNGADPNMAFQPLPQLDAYQTVFAQVLQGIMSQYQATKDTLYLDVVRTLLANGADPYAGDERAKTLSAHKFVVDYGTTGANPKNVFARNVLDMFTIPKTKAARAQIVDALRATDGDHAAAAALVAEAWYKPKDVARKVAAYKYNRKELKLLDAKIKAAQREVDFAEGFDDIAREREAKQVLQALKNERKALLKFSGSTGKKRMGIDY